ncbi:uncharacterized protein PHALS_04627 [Plasmopara halstedii]|uniref:Uncharacterized protein n=1 Tax=Plasmopara halstedii TaxID=4781 RepID=A0A0P1A9N2_PLAHL|nr:uncharacterized protein PHALS_04627 [Plasmopara halstedii]CEG37180.1 hypothetical protein PHALS_04627 [Plasmopara halstedii]|eukprot:XP_024573549.1 hypothetical protein PHALS_04627 [Plasmopara halstedii]
MFRSSKFTFFCDDIKLPYVAVTAVKLCQTKTRFLAGAQRIPPLRCEIVKLCRGHPRLFR